MPDEIILDVMPDRKSENFSHHTDFLGRSPIKIAPTRQNDDDWTNEDRRTTTRALILQSIY